MNSCPGKSQEINIVWTADKYIENIRFGTSSQTLQLHKVSYLWSTFHVSLLYISFRPCNTLIFFLLRFMFTQLRHFVFIKSMLVSEDNKPFLLLINNTKQYLDIQATMRFSRHTWKELTEGICPFKPCFSSPLKLHTLVRSHKAEKCSALLCWWPLVKYGLLSFPRCCLPSDMFVCLLQLPFTLMFLIYWVGFLV